MAVTGRPEPNFERVSSRGVQGVRIELSARHVRFLVLLARS
jgi:hypothetical protein